jgi:hypothetical protein
MNDFPPGNHKFSPTIDSRIQSHKALTNSIPLVTNESSPTSDSPTVERHKNKREIFPIITTCESLLLLFLSIHLNTTRIDWDFSNFPIQILWEENPCRFLSCSSDFCNEIRQGFSSHRICMGKFEKSQSTLVVFPFFHSFQHDENGQGLFQNPHTNPMERKSLSILVGLK